MQSNCTLGLVVDMGFELARETGTELSQVVVDICLYLCVLLFSQAGY